MVLGKHEDHEASVHQNGEQHYSEDCEADEEAQLVQLCHLRVSFLFRKHIFIAKEDAREFTKQ